MAELEANGVRLYYELYGSGEPLALVHGAWANATFWQSVVPGLAESFRALVYDRRGHSRSERPDAQLARLREQLRAVPADDVATWAHVARETAGAFAAWSVRVEPTPGPLAAAAAELTRSAQLHAHQVGLSAAVETLARRAAIPVEVTAMPSGRLPETVESAAYYVAAEGLANVVKHAGASHVQIGVTRDDGRVIVEVSDDGRGGAKLGGSGLRGLRDRVEAIDGRLTISSAAGRGTMLRAELPCA